MYGKDSEFIDVNNVTQLAKTLNKSLKLKFNNNLTLEIWNCEPNSLSLESNNNNEK